MAIKIAFFNHKGGVSKTTSAYHLGWMLTNKGKRVLLVDADSQCNLTITIIGEEQYEQYAIDNPTNNLKDALTPAFKSQPALIQAVDCVEVKGNNKLFLLPGSFDITEYEVQLGVSFQLSNSFSTMTNLPGSFNYLLSKTADTYNVDYIIIDFNPSLSAINQDLLISSDYFIIPTSPDYFSKMAVKSLARILPIWENWAKQARNTFKDATYSLPLNTPKFLGYVVSDYTTRNGKPANQFQAVIDEIQTVVKDVMVPSLSSVDMLLDAAKYNGDDYCLAQIPNFHTFQPKFQKFGIPVYELSDQQLGTKGLVLDRQELIREKLRVIFSDFADKVISMTT